MIIDSFTKEYQFLSNFYPVEIELNGRIYASVEHAYQAQKCRQADQMDLFTIDKGLTPNQAKKLGRTLELRHDWDEVKRVVMHLLLCKKFSNPELKALLKATAPKELIEGNWWGDTYWGVCKGVGFNYLGKSLMSIRQAMLFGQKVST